MFIEPKDLALVKDILQKHVPEYEVWAFGSRVHGEHLKKFSDFDLAIVSDNPLPFDTIYRLKDAFIESYLPFKVDVLEYSSASEKFREIIKQNYEVIQKKI